ncbi:hypothetical protein, partial [Zymobacter palmae]
RLPPAACRLPPAACRLPPAACRLPPAACRLPPRGNESFASELQKKILPLVGKSASLSVLAFLR